MIYLLETKHHMIQLIRSAVILQHPPIPLEILNQQSWNKGNTPRNIPPKNGVMSSIYCQVSFVVFFMCVCVFDFSCMKEKPQVYEVWHSIFAKKCWSVSNPREKQTMWTKKQPTNNDTGCCNVKGIATQNLWMFCCFCWKTVGFSGSNATLPSLIASSPLENRPVYPTRKPDRFPWPTIFPGFFFVVSLRECRKETGWEVCCLQKKSRHLWDWYIPRTQLTSIFEGQPSKTRPLSIKTRVIWVLGYLVNWHCLHECWLPHLENNKCQGTIGCTVPLSCAHGIYCVL